MRTIATALALGAVACHNAAEPSVSATSIARRLSVGETTACALDGAGVVNCWGQNGSQWQYGESPATQPSSAVPVAVPIPPLVSLAAGVSQDMCGITTSQTAVCWGRGGYGQLGSGTTGLGGNPATTVLGAIRWADIAVSRLSTCGLDVNHTAYCWGSNQHGEVGVDTVPPRTLTGAPIATAGNFPFAAIAPGWIHACGIVLGGRVFCWGDNSRGQLGIGAADTLDHLTATPVAGDDHFVQLSSGSMYTCGITTDHRALCWGANTTGQLGDGTTTDHATPTPVSGNLSFVAIAVGSGFGGGTTIVTSSPAATHACALDQTGAAYCWGLNTSGQVGDGTLAVRVTPTPVAGGLTFTSLGLGGAYSCGMRGSAIWCWGSNLYGQLGNAGVTGAGAFSSVPVQVQPPFAKP